VPPVEGTGMLRAVRSIGISALAAVCALSACTRKLAIEVVLIAPKSPPAFENDDPDRRVSEVRLRALVSGRIVDVGGGRWDLGALSLPQTIDPTVERIVVEGRSASQRLISSGVSAPLDLLRAPPANGRISILFTRVGALSVLAESGPRRTGARAVELDRDRVMFAGGTAEGGAALESTEIFDARALAIGAGPDLPGGRTGDFALRRLPGGAVVVALGSSPNIAVLDADSLGARIAGEVVPSVRKGAAVAAVSDTLVLIGGGDEAPAVSDAVYRFNPQTLSFESPGLLGEPRAETGAEIVGGDRVLFVGGRSAIDVSSALPDAVVFDPSRGSTSPAAIDLVTSADIQPPPAPRPVRKLIAPAVKTTLAGSVVVAGGIGPDGASSTFAGAIVVPPDRALATVGDTSFVAALQGDGGRGELIDLLDGSLLFVPEGEGDLTWIHLAPSGAERVERMKGVGRLIGGRALDGSAVFRAEDGRYLWFNAGVSAVFGSYGISGGLRSPTEPTTAIVPRRPAAWTLDQGGLTGRLLPGVVGEVAPAEIAVLGNTVFQDFDVTAAFVLTPNSSAALVFGLTTSAFDEIAFTGQSALVSRFDAKGMRIQVPCEALATPTLSDGNAHRVRVRRSDRELRIDVDPDGNDDLVCKLPVADAGLIAFGIINRQATLVDLTVAATGGL
jgi:hypothetical protein